MTTKAEVYDAYLEALVDLALKIWNSRAPLSYHRKVMDKYNEIKEARP